MGNCSYDALIVGGGPAGATAALGLAQCGWRVCLLHRAQPRASVHARTGETLPSASRATLRALGLWSTFLQDGHVPSPGTVAWWDAENPIEQDSVFDPWGPAWHIDRWRFDHRLREAAAVAGAEVLDGLRLVDAQRLTAARASGAACWSASLRDETRTVPVRARVLIVATGRGRHPVACGGRRGRLDRLIGLAALVPAGEPLASVDQRIWIEATPEGWWYSAPTPGGPWTITFFTDADRVPREKGRDGISRYWREQFLGSQQTKQRIAHLTSFAPMLGTVTMPGALRVFAADSYRSAACHGPGWMAAGDAVSAWDPLSGQGIENALQSGSRVARAVHAILQGGDAGAICRDYADEVEARDGQYRRDRSAYYGRVQRWPDAVFWRRRTRQDQ
ncbi:2-octaprenyl-3-methyl-6-methoxy-1,4-benzoquinol hydroxylase [Luteitalea pratensis]|uniref:2-octaprenyl-3-methyl-6-methoxy-1,4-benzoquinol hydroxylase n=1 Tax=Luteitalea pratensis TaxID=1855912 RepID=A0A143PQ47_LUTPR|nr:FAD-dependent monooxygenase [Luteitalea pratensis]AMY10837.1 2-octaprenyl-3-methyl-6-methoxy-1,4-benzoquinol hydroxylase [Luteitalea pratensis]